MGRKVPPKITVREIADATGWSTERTRGVLRRAGVLEKDGRNGVVRRSRLMEREPDIFQDVFDYFDLMPSPDDAAHREGARRLERV